MQRGGTRAKCAGRAQDISANNIRQTACALVLVCQQVQEQGQDITQGLQELGPCL
jgi:hypothetical protein